MNRSRLLLAVTAVVVVPLAVHAVLEAAGLWPQAQAVISVLVGVALLLYWVPGHVHGRSLARTVELAVAGAAVIYLVGVGVRAADALTLSAVYGVVADDVAVIAGLVGL